MNTLINTTLVHSGESVFTVEDRLWKRNGAKAGIVFAHGAGGTGLTPNDTTAPGQRNIIRALAPTWPVVSSDWGGTQTWGNTTARERVAEAPAYLQTTLGAKVGAHIGIGASMGCFSIMSTALANPTMFSCIVLILGLVDLDDIHTNDRGSQGFRSAINTAYTITDGDLVPAGFNPALSTTALSAIPGQIWSASDDTIGLASLAQTFATATGWEFHNLGALGHTDTAIAAVDTAAVRTFITAHT